jgi:hypothetical protein
VIVVSVDVTVDAIVFVIIAVTVACAWVVDVTEDVMVMLEQAGEAGRLIDPAVRLAFLSKMMKT